MSLHIVSEIVNKVLVEIASNELLLSEEGAVRYAIRKQLLEQGYCLVNLTTTQKVFILFKNNSNHSLERINLTNEKGKSVEYQDIGMEKGTDLVFLLCGNNKKPAAEQNPKALLEYVINCQKVHLELKVYTKYLFERQFQAVDVYRDIAKSAKENGIFSCFFFDRCEAYSSTGPRGRPTESDIRDLFSKTLNGDASDFSVKKPITEKTGDNVRGRLEKYDNLISGTGLLVGDRGTVPDYFSPHAFITTAQKKQID